MVTVARRGLQALSWSAFVAIALLMMSGKSVALAAAGASIAPECAHPREIGCSSPLPDLRATLYYTALEADYVRGTEAAFRDRLGRVLRRGSGEFVAAAAIEGSVRFDDGEVLNYDRRIGPEVRWLRTDAPLGVDARGCELIAFRSAAVDPDVIAPGTVLLLEETRGMPLPDGTLHDGIWVAGDTGEAIRGQRIDLFTGAGMASMTVPRAFGIRHMQPLTVWNLGLKPGCRGYETFQKTDTGRDEPQL